MSNSSDMIASLQGILAQMEAAAGGAEDSEARAALDILQSQLNALHAAQHATATPAAAVEPNQPLENAAANVLRQDNGPQNGESSAPQQVESLEKRLQVLEQRVAGLDRGAIELIAMHGGALLGSLQDAGVDNNTGLIGDEGRALENQSDTAGGGDVGGSNPK